MAPEPNCTHATVLRLADASCRDPACSHLPEPVRERLTDAQRLAAALQTQRDVARVVAADRVDLLDVDDARAMDLPEHLRVELLEEIPQGHVDQGIAVSRGDEGVARVRLEVADLLDRDHADVRASRRSD